MSHRTVRRSVLLSVASVAFAVGCVTATTARDVVVPPATAAPVGPAWEYACPRLDTFGVTQSDFTEQIEAELDAFGAEGWELVGSFGDSRRVCLKRPKP